MDSPPNETLVKARSESTQNWELTASFAESVSRSFWCPIEGARNPNCDEVERVLLDWVDRIGLGDNARRRATIVAAHSTDFYGRVAPAASFEGLFVATLWNCIGFAIDDEIHDQGPDSFAMRHAIPMAGRMQRALEGHRPEPNIDDPFVVATYDLGRHLRAHSSPTQVRRFYDAHWGWMAGVCWQASSATSGQLPSRNEYLVTRMYCAAGGPTYALIEIANGLPDIPAEEHRSDPVLALTEMAMLIAALDNDAYSIGKELLQGQSEQNIYSVVAAEYGGTPEQVASHATALRDRMLLRFLSLRERTIPGASPQLRRYLEDLGNCIRGNIEYGVRAARYRVARPDSPADVHWRPTPLGMDATGGDIDLSTIPPIAWWQRV